MWRKYSMELRTASLQRISEKCSSPIPQSTHERRRQWEAQAKGQPVVNQIPNPL